MSTDQVRDAEALTDILGAWASTWKVWEPSERLEYVIPEEGQKVKRAPSSEHVKLAPAALSE